MSEREKYEQTKEPMAWGAVGSLRSYAWEKGALRSLSENAK